MYCQSCGAERQPGLNYCNRCGAAASPAPAQELAPIDLRGPFRVTGLTVGLTTVLGLIVLFLGLSGLASWIADKDIIMVIGVVGLLMLFGLDLSFIYLLSRLVNMAQESGQPMQLKKPNPKELRAAQTGPAFPDSVSSVTEHTTRTFSPVYKEPRA